MVKPVIGRFGWNLNYVVFANFPNLKLRRFRQKENLKTNTLTLITLSRLLTLS